MNVATEPQLDSACIVSRTKLEFVDCSGTCSASRCISMPRKPGAAAAARPRRRPARGGMTSTPTPRCADLRRDVERRLVSPPRTREGPVPGRHLTRGEPVMYRVRQGTPTVGGAGGPPVCRECTQYERRGGAAPPGRRASEGGRRHGWDCIQETRIGTRPVGALCSGSVSGGGPRCKRCQVDR